MPTWGASAWRSPYLRVPRADGPPSAGAFDSTSFDPVRWKANYPNPAFANLRPDDAFWGARLVARFSDDSDSRDRRPGGVRRHLAGEHIARVLIERRDAIARTWLNGVNPIVDPRLAADGTLTFENAAVAAGAATPGQRLHRELVEIRQHHAKAEPMGDGCR